MEISSQRQKLLNIVGLYLYLRLALHPDFPAPVWRSCSDPITYPRTFVFLWHVVVREGRRVGQRKFAGKK